MVYITLSETMDFASNFSIFFVPPECDHQSCW